jgi:hypothetical protein
MIVLPPCLTVKQPYASAIIAGVKPVEYRTWRAPDRLIGEMLLIHAGKRLATETEYRQFANGPRGAILGAVIVVDCIDGVDWWEWVVRDPVVFCDPVHAIGRLQLWPVPNVLRASVAHQLAMAGRRARSVAPS